jgi:predicted Zn-dependent protease
LDAILAGKTQEVAVQDSLKIEPDAFDEAFAEWAARRVSVWGLPVRGAEKPDELKALVEESPTDAALLARLAHAEWRDQKRDDAEETARRSLALRENQPLALEVLAHVLVNRALSEKDEGFRQGYLDRAEPVVRRLHAVDPHNAAAVKYLGYVEQSRRHWQAAIRFLSHYQRRFPEDPDPYRRLAAIYLEQGDHEAAVTQLERLFQLVDDEPAVARQIASIHREHGRHRRVAHWLRRAIEIDPYDPATHEELADACLASGRYAAAEVEYKVLCRLAPESPAGYKGLARLCETVGNSTEAAAYKKKAEALHGTVDDDRQP